MCVVKSMTYGFYMQRTPRELYPTIVIDCDHDSDIVVASYTTRVEFFRASYLFPRRKHN